MESLIKEKGAKQSEFIDKKKKEKRK